MATGNEDLRMARVSRIQQTKLTAETTGGGAKNVKTRARQSAKKQALRSAAKLGRTTFFTSREMDFFNEKELVTQTGHPKAEWPQVIIKELIDNSLDACEEADDAQVAPTIDQGCQTVFQGSQRRVLTALVRRRSGNNTTSAVNGCEANIY
jgi:hypothetical protein